MRDDCLHPQPTAIASTQRKGPCSTTANILPEHPALVVYCASSLDTDCSTLCYKQPKEYTTHQLGTSRLMQRDRSGVQKKLEEKNNKKIIYYKTIHTTEQPRRMALDPSSSTKRTANSDTDSAYSTESESNHTAHLPRPPCSPKPTRQHLRPSTSSQSITILEEEISSTSTRTRPAPPPRSPKSQQITNTKCIRETKPLHIPIPKPSTSTRKTSYLSTSTHLQEPSTST